MAPAYDSDYFELVERQSRSSAEVIVPILVDLVGPASVLDVGCGTGLWLKSFRDLGVADAFGIDGDWVDRSSLRIPEYSFEAVDLERASQTSRRFDLVLSLEVAEHLSPEAADGFVDLLTGAGGVVAFSAAIPGQGGTGHVNEQWPAYWSERFAERGFVAFDSLRPRIWSDPRIAWWFRQNLVLFVAEERLGEYPQLGEPSGTVLPLVHPELLKQRVEASEPPAPSEPASPAPAPAPPPLWHRVRAKVRLRTRLRALATRLPRRRRRRRILALVPIRDEIRFLPGLLANLEGEVDGVVALDDGSTDGSRDFLEQHPFVLALASVPPGAQEEMEDGKNHLQLLDAAQGHGADWFLGVDADERLERGFRDRAEEEIDRAEKEGHAALWIPFRELWGTPDTVRMDGLWAEKRKASLFRADPAARFDKKRLHSIWAPWPPLRGEYPIADLRLYHLRMIRPEDRQARADLYNRIDPDRRWQAIGYDYLVDEAELRLDPIEAGRDYAPKPA